MATCKVCIHYEVCKDYIETLAKAKNADLEAVSKWLDEMTSESAQTDCECEHFKDRSRFVELPCKVGDTAYIIHSYKDYEGFIQEVTVSGIHLRDTIGYRNIPRAEYLVVRGNVNLSKHIKLKEIGKTVFFTREEAERALRALKEKEKIESERKIAVQQT